MKNVIQFPANMPAWGKKDVDSHVEGHPWAAEILKVCTSETFDNDEQAFRFYAQSGTKLRHFDVSADKRFFWSSVVSRDQMARQTAAQMERDDEATRDAENGHPGARDVSFD